MNYKLFFSNKNPKIILGFIFLIIFIFRLPTLLIDFYDVDELIYSACANEIVAGGTPYVDYVEQRPILTHYFYAFVYLIFGKNNLYAIHFVTIILILLSSFYAYKTILIFTKEKSSAYFSAFAYGILITAFDESFMATNSEVIFNLPISIACYFFVKYYFTDNKRYFLLILCALSITMAFMIKQQGGVILGVITIYVVFGYFFTKKRFSLKDNLYIPFHLLVWFLLFLFVIHFFMYLGGFLTSAIEWTWLFPFVYIKSSTAPIIDILIRYINKQLPLLIPQIIFWLFLVGFIWKLFKFDKELIDREKEKSYFLLILFLFSYLTIFLGGIRLYHHYFVQYLLPLSLIAGFQFFRWRKVISKRVYLVIFNGLIIFPIILFTAWHYHDIYKKYYSENPLSKRNLNYLTERPEFKEITHWIREDNSPNVNDKIFVWGECPQIYYFANRRLGGRFIMFNFIHLDNSFANKQNERAKRKLNKYLTVLLKDLENKKPRYIIDASLSSLYESNRFPIWKYPLIYNYLLKHYELKNISFKRTKMKIWEIKLKK
ncbi:MAG: glycosyltransferase family 39 protein [Spirochaetota bacterium]|nr:glycosyltransferase family 39 protein [Spirochaetota bacterium]